MTQQQTITQRSTISGVVHGLVELVEYWIHTAQVVGSMPMLV